MLTKLTIKNIALIEYAEIEFTKGLNILSGETGSGKSVIIESLDFILGAKADKSLIKSGETECSVTAEFDVSHNSKVKSLFEELEFDVEDLLLITRKFNLEGKSTIKINGNSATVSMLKRFSSILLDVHGQSEHFYLLNTNNQLELIDKISGEPVQTSKLKLSELFTEYRKITGELKSLGGNENERLIRLDILNYQIDEINKASIEDGEKEKLLQIKEKLIHQEKIVNALRSVKESISEEGGILDIIYNAEKSLSSISNFSDNYNDLYERLCSVSSEIDDISSSASNYLDENNFEEYDIDYIENRLDIIKNIFKKYASDYNELQVFLENAIKEKEKLENFNDLAKELLEKKDKFEHKIYDEYKNLSSLRQKCFDIFKNNVTIELRELGMEKAQFSAEFNVIPNFEDCKFTSTNGIDEINFLFSANLGEPLKPLSSVISGGEISRFMLAIKAQTSKYNDIDTFIFDEIDSGISGHIAKVVAEKIVQISSSAQIISITHLPQIACMGDNNLLIYKIEENGKTYSKVKTIRNQEKTDEIVRLLGGENTSEFAKKHAVELIDNANKYKQQL